ncbi:hypothetical protein Tco_0750707 [Tanacetum coccineum]|uniref:Uncharacterized protein n=1 Tax=Tanacetum coccineum TaxID=301880 RepID=A0ABQ4Z4L2_9ASTR
MALATRNLANTSANDELVIRHRLDKVELPKFYGEDVLGWNFKCDQFFLIDNTPKEEKEYQDTFDNLLSRVEVSEEHVISLNLGGLPTELEMSATLEAVKKKSRPFMNQTTRRFGVSNLNGSNKKKSLLPLPTTNNNWKPKTNTPLSGIRIKQLTQKEYKDKRSKNLCFYCDQKYVLGHKCSGQMYSLIVLVDNKEEEEEYLDANETLVDAVSEEVQAHISLNALSGVSSF